MAVQGLGGAFRGCATGDEGFGSGEAKASDDFPSRLCLIFGGDQPGNKAMTSHKSKTMMPENQPSHRNRKY